MTAVEERFYDVTIYEADCDDFDNEGICGPLFPTQCYHDEEGNGGSDITLEHPFDDQGKWREITAGRFLKCWVQIHIPPEIDGSRIVTSVEKWTVKTTATSAQRAMYNKKSGGKKLKTLPKGLSVTVVKKPDSGRYKIKSSSHGTGYVSADALEYETSMLLPETPEGIETAEPGGCISWQLFEITKVRRKDDSGIVANAHQISYQMLTNNTTWKTTGAASIGTALTGIMENCLDPHEFNAYTDMADTRTGFGWAHLNPIKCMLDPEAGITALFPCELIRDNWDLYFLSSAGRNRGLRIEPGKNMEGVEYEEDMNGLYTHILPIGHNKKGEEIFLPEKFVVSPVADAYSRKFIYPLECKDCDVGKNGVTTEMAYARMREQAQAVLDGGCDMITKSVKITMTALRGEAGEKIAAAVESCLLYDYVTALHPDFGIDLVLKVAKRRWDCLRGRLISVELGTVGATLATSSLASWQIPNGVSGSKIIAGSVGSSALSDEAIGTRHLQAESVNADAIAAKSIAAKHIASGVVETLALEAFTAKIEKLTASDISTDRLAAAMAAFTVITAGTATFDQATIQHLVAKAMNLSFGTADEVFINNLRVLYGQMVQATIGNLCIKASDGNYYAIDVDANGHVTAAMSAVTEDEITAGQTGAGKVILETNITAESLNTGNLMATYALINKIDAARIDVDELWAREAFIAHLITTDISGNGYIQQTVRNIVTGEVEKYTRLDAEGLHVGDPDSTSEMLIDDRSLNARVNGQIYTKLGPNYVTFGGYNQYKTADGGMAFKVKE